MTVLQRSALSPRPLDRAVSRASFVVSALLVAVLLAGIAPPASAAVEPVGGHVGMGSAVDGAHLAASIPNTDPFVPPSETVVPPSTDDCGQRAKPPPPVDTSEDVPPGSPAVKPLPVPEQPVGGGRLGECGLIVPKGAPPLPSDISAAAWLIADLDTGEVLAAKDPHGRYRPASTLKLLTAQVMLKNLRKLDKVVKGTSTDAGQDGTRVGIEDGGKYTIRQLLTYLIIISGNDAANALARENGGYDETIADMNATAKALGALDTRAATVSGLDGPGQSTSAYDLALFAKADMATPPFPEIVSSVDVRVPSASGEGYIAANDNQLLYQYKGALGGKTGFTDDAGNTYVGMAERDGRRLVVTMLNGTQQPRRQWMQAASLLDWGFALPPTTQPVGKLVGSLAEATAVSAAPTPSTGPPPSPSAESTTASSVAAPTDSTSVNGDPQPAASTSSGVSTALVLAGIGVLVVLAGLLLLLRRRRLNKRAVLAGDAAPAPGEPAVEDPAPPAGAPTVDEAPPPPAGEGAEAAASPGDAPAPGGASPAEAPRAEIPPADDAPPPTEPPPTEAPATEPPPTDPPNR
ncbi:D-alanyl-D-alanine carboxypeptidase family protein [Nakamurella sp. GG22]